jgi:membrane-bound lytic murein transglycosylase MltF
MTDPTQNFEQVISDFEKQQADYQAALIAKQAHEDNERRLREAYFQQQRIAYEEGQKRDRRCELVQEIIGKVSDVIQSLEWGQTESIAEKLTSIEAGMQWLLTTGALRDGK